MQLVYDQINSIYLCRSSTATTPFYLLILSRCTSVNNDPEARNIPRPLHRFPIPRFIQVKNLRLISRSILAAGIVGDFRVQPSSRSVAPLFGQHCGFIRVPRMYCVRSVAAVCLSNSWSWHGWINGSGRE